MKRKKVEILLLAGTMCMTGCSIKNPVSALESTMVAESTTQEETTAASDDSVNKLDVSDMFTNRDKEIGYDEESSVLVVLADGKSSCDSDTVLIDENVITITEEGTYVLSGALSDGIIIVDAGDSDKVQLVLNGVEITSAESAAIYVRSADKVFITTASGSENTLTNGGSYTAIDDNHIDAVIFSKEDLTLNGAGTLTIDAKAGHGVVSKDDLVLTSGTYKITAEKHGLSGKDSVRIADGTYSITSGKDGIHAANKDDESLGFVYISGGNIQITADDDGIHADSEVVIEGGTIEVTESYEGIEGLSIDITGGSIDVTASDDGFNAARSKNSSQSDGKQEDTFAAQEGAYIHISGGIIHVNASGDGIDSNGDLIVSGGETYVSGPTDNANGAVDYDGEGVISGGIFVAAGSSGMAQNFGDASTQGVMLVDMEKQTAGSTISLTDSNGEELISWTPDKEYESVVVSCPEIVQGAAYSLMAGDSTQQIVMDSLVYGTGGMGSQPAGGPGHGAFGGPRGERPKEKAAD